jgi:holin-like protein
MLVGFLVLLLGFWIGEAGSSVLSLPVPGAVLGMASLVLVLGLRRRTPVGLERAADGLLSHLPLLFVPAGVGVVKFIGPLRADWLPVLLTLFGGTLLTVAVTALSLRAFLALQGRGRTGEGAP